MMLLSATVSTAQTLYGYEFSTDVDSTKWIPLTQPTTMLECYSQLHGLQHGSSPISMGFHLWMMRTDVTYFSVHRSGRMLLNSVYQNNDYRTIRMQWWSDQNYLMPYGVIPNFDSSGTVACQLLGTSGNHVLVCQFTMPVTRAASPDSFQIQLFESTSSIRYVYAPRNSSLPGPSGQIGLAQNSLKYISVRPDLQTAAANDNYEPFNLPWPGNWRYYEFNPRCPGVTGFRADSVRYASTRLTWDTFPQHTLYLIEYDTAGFPSGTGGIVTTTDHIVHLNGLVPNTRYEARIRSVCDNGDTAIDATSVTFTTEVYACSNIQFTDLNGPDVECLTGSFANPDNMGQVVNYGPSEIRSRHTVHVDTAERDAMTGNMLRTIPPGHCNSVRLGNSLTGNQQESITYTLTIDTQNYDLLILRYAMVDKLPNHEPEEQPYFTFSFLDGNGHLIDSCYYANFVSGSGTGWNVSTNSSSVVWRDWSAVGVDLSPFHGQTVKVKLSNADCSQGGHWGYAYFTLEGTSKHISSTTCGAAIENTFRAPQGFSYRWYNATDSATTLSTAETLHVTTPGQYCCRLSYNLGGRDCGITMSTRAGPRYPVARFTSDPEDSCEAVRRFFNQSVVATDAARTQLTSEPCERFLWRFDDGTTDTVDNPVHTFSNGQHSVTLVAMLADGTCANSYTSTFSVFIPSNTIQITRCPGASIVINGRWITDTGFYTYVEDCFAHRIHYAWYPISRTLLYDTLCEGDTLLFGPYRCTDSGRYSYTTTDIHGCDSHLTLQLHYIANTYRHISDTLPLGGLYAVGDTAFVAPGRYSYQMHTSQGCNIFYDIELSCRLSHDTTVCISSLPVEWDGHLFTTGGTQTFSHLSQAGTDSIIEYTLHVRPKAKLQYLIDQSCEADGYFVLLFYDTNQHQLISNPTDNTVEMVSDGQRYHLHPQQTTRYFLYADYADEPSCTSVDSIDLNPADLIGITLDFVYQPEIITSDNTELTLTDHSRHILSRQWYVNRVPLMETERNVHADIPPAIDSLTVCLVGYRSFCSDTLCKVIPIQKYVLWFPNVFTPGRDDNNLFRAEGVNIYDFELWIYDRRGKLVFHSTDIHGAWDGTHNGTPCSQGTYAYNCRYAIPGGQIRSQAGIVTLLR